MQNLPIAIASAVATPFGTQAHDLALGLCALQGLDPNEQMHVPGFSEGPPIYRWHLLLAEEVLRALLRKELAV